MNLASEFTPRKIIHKIHNTDKTKGSAESLPAFLYRLQSKSDVIRRIIVNSDINMKKGPSPAKSLTNVPGILKCNKSLNKYKACFMLVTPKNNHAIVTTHIVHSHPSIPPIFPEAILGLILHSAYWNKCSTSNQQPCIPPHTM